MANQVDESKPLNETRVMFGRRIIKTSVTEITEDNVVDVLNKAMATHSINRSEIDYLWKYYRGDQPILRRKKDVRPEICNKIVENRANEIVSFKVGYLCGEPIQYVSRKGGEEIVSQINALNEMMFAEDISFPALRKSSGFKETTCCVLNGRAMIAQRQFVAKTFSEIWILNTRRVCIVRLERTTTIWRKRFCLTLACLISISTRG